MYCRLWPIALFVNGRPRVGCSFNLQLDTYGITGSGWSKWTRFWYMLGVKVDRSSRYLSVKLKRCTHTHHSRWCLATINWSLPAWAVLQLARDYQSPTPQCAWLNAVQTSGDMVIAICYKHITREVVSGPIKVAILQLKHTQVIDQACSVQHTSTCLYHHVHSPYNDRPCKSWTLVMCLLFSDTR